MLPRLLVLDDGHLAPVVKVRNEPPDQLILAVQGGFALALAGAHRTVVINNEFESVRNSAQFTLSPLKAVNAVLAIA